LSSGSVGNVTVSGAGSSFTASNFLDVGTYGTGTLAITSGGTVVTPYGYVGFFSGSNGAVTVDGAGSSLNASNWVDVGTYGPGTLTLSNGGTVHVGSAPGDLSLGYYTGGTGTLNIGAPAGSGPAPGGIVNSAYITTGGGTGTLQFNTTATSGSPYFLTANGTSGGTPIALQGSLAVVINSGATVLNGANTYYGGTTDNGSIVDIESNSGLGTGPVTTTAGSTLNFTSSSPTINELSMVGTTVNFAASSTPTIVTLISDSMSDGNVINLGNSAVLTINNNEDPTFYGSINGPGELSVGGGGALELAGVSNYSGGTSIIPNSYTLLVASNSSALGTGPVTVNQNTAFGMNSSTVLTNQFTLNSGGAIGGYGTIAPASADPITVANGSTITGGKGTIGIISGGSQVPVVGTLTIGANAALSLGPNGNIDFSIMNATGTSGTDFSAINYAGNLDITATPGTPFNILLVSVNPGTQQSGVANFNSALSYSWTLITSSSGITGFNANDFVVNSSEYFQNSIGSGHFFVTDFGSELVLNFTPVPEPSTWALMAGGLCLLGASVRRWRRYSH
jgi:T5SS/PEP-CTERM-associated repeat protein